MSEASTVRSTLQSLDDRFGGQGFVYLVLSGTSESAPVRNFYRTDGLTARPLYMGTAYAGWHEVMPFLAQVTLDSGFWDWLEEEGANDWGFALYSNAPFDEVFAHWRSLTKIALSSGKEVFFRHWDARFLCPILASLEDSGRNALMGPARAIVTPDAEAVYPTEGHSWVFEDKAFPWFVLPAEAEKKVASLCWDLLVDNTVAALASVPRTPLATYPPAVGRRKVEKQLRRQASGGVITELSPQQIDDIHQALVRERHQAQVGMRN